MPTAESKKKKVLIVTFAFPPLNVSGAVRVGKFAKCLPEFGWEPIVLTADIARGQPQTLPLEVDEAKVIRTSYLGLTSLLKREPGGYSASGKPVNVPWWSRAVRGGIRLLRPILNLPLIRDLTYPILRAFTSPWLGWYRQPVRKGLELMARNGIQLLFSSSYPPTSHLIASRLHRQTGIPWVAEFRDPWSLNEYENMTKSFRSFQKIVEKRTLRRSSLLITVSEPLAEELEKLHSKKTIVIPNGFDEEDYTRDVPFTQKFTITYTGNIYPGKRDPTPLFKAIAELRQEGRISPGDLEVRFFGSNVTANISPLIQEYNLAELVKIYGFISFKESIKAQKESSVLLLLEWNDPRGKGTSTAKIFEYLGAGRPILAIAFKGGVIDNLLLESGCGLVLTELDEIKALILEWLQEFRQHREILSHYKPNWSIVKQYTRREQARKLAEAFDEVVGSLAANNAIR